jgi:N utilization substance protein B
MSDFIDFDPEGDEVVNRETIEHEPPSTERSMARRVALQALYEVDSAGHDVGEVLTNLLNHSAENRKVKGYLTRLATGIDRNKVQLDAVLQKYAPEWPIGQVAVIDRNILRIALYEMAVDIRTPVGVAIDEAIELAKLFGADNTPRFINGVLGSIADNLEEVRQSLTTETPLAPDIPNVEEDTDD